MIKIQQVSGMLIFFAYVVGHARMMMVRMVMRAVVGTTLTMMMKARKRVVLYYDHMQKGSRNIPANDNTTAYSNQ